MRTAGVDLAAQDKNTAACVVDWGSGGPRVELPRVGLDDDPLLDVICDSDRTGIDAPLTSVDSGGCSLGGRAYPAGRSACPSQEREDQRPAALSRALRASFLNRSACRTFGGIVSGTA